MPKFETKSKINDKIVYSFIEFIVTHKLTNSVLTNISTTSYVSENNLFNKLAKLNPYIVKREKSKIIHNDLKENKYDDNLSLIKGYKNIGE